MPDPAGPAPRTDRARPEEGRGNLAFAATFFVLSGAAALVYQVAWQRLLALTSGVAVHSVAVITAAFLAGLGIGSHAGGVVSARLSPRRSLLAFALIELGVAAFAVLSVPLYYGLLYEQAASLYDGIVQATVTHFFSLLPPTALMGMSLPFLVRGLVRDREAAAGTIGILYGANALGAAAGAALTPWVLMRFLGVSGAIYAGAVGSALAALGALVLVPRVYEPAGGGDEAAGLTPAVPPATATGEPAHPFRLWVVLYALSGFVSLSLEVVWFRVLDVAAKGFAFTFGTLLAIYLVGLAAGTFVAAHHAARIRRPLALFLLCQVGIVLVTVLAHALLVWLPSDWPLLSWIVAYGKKSYGVQLQPFDATQTFSIWQFLAVYAALPLALFGPSTFLMGVGFPVLQRATQEDPKASGFRVGLLQAANITGCALGSLLTGLVLLDRIGTPGVFRVLGLVSCAVAVFGWRATGERRFAGLAAVLLVLVIAFPGRERFWLRLHGDPPPRQSLVEEDAASVTAVTPQPGSYKLWINGRQNSWLPFAWLHTVVGALPALAHPRPAEVAVIGLGSGDTAWASACRAETQRVVVFEIASSTPRLLTRVAAQLPDMGRLQEFLADPRMTVVKDDGRRRLRADSKRYDIIVADAVDYDASMSNNLYSVEFYRLVADALKPGGLVCVLARTPRIRAALRRSLPYTLEFGREDLLLASAQPIDADSDLWLERLRSPRVVDYFGKSRLWEIEMFINKVSYGRAAAPTAEVNRDLEPRDEFLRPMER